MKLYNGAGREKIREGRGKGARRKIDVHTGWKRRSSLTVTLLQKAGLRGSIPLEAANLSRNALRSASVFQDCTVYKLVILSATTFSFCLPPSLPLFFFFFTYQERSWKVWDRALGKGPSALQRSSYCNNAWALSESTEVKITIRTKKEEEGVGREGHDVTHMVRRKINPWELVPIGRQERIEWMDLGKV